MCPPICLIPRAIQHARKCSAVATLLVPQWPSAPFWPMIFPNSTGLASFVSEYVVIPKSQLIVHPGRLGSSLFKGSPIQIFWPYGSIFEFGMIGNRASVYLANMPLITAGVLFYFCSQSAGYCCSQSAGYCHSQSAGYCHSQSAGYCHSQSAGYCYSQSAGYCHSQSAGYGYSQSVG